MLRQNDARAKAPPPNPGSALPACSPAYCTLETESFLVQRPPFSPRPIRTPRLFQLDTFGYSRTIHCDELHVHMVRPVPALPAPHTSVGGPKSFGVRLGIALLSGERAGLSSQGTSSSARRLVPSACANPGSCADEAFTIHYRPHPAEEVFVTGTFDNWGKSVKLDKSGEVFKKTVNLPKTGEKILYKVCIYRLRLFFVSGAHLGVGRGGVQGGRIRG